MEVLVSRSIWKGNKNIQKAFYGSFNNKFLGTSLNGFFYHFTNFLEGFLSYFESHTRKLEKILKASSNTLARTRGKVEGEKWLQVKRNNA